MKRTIDGKDWRKTGSANGKHFRESSSLQWSASMSTLDMPTYPPCWELWEFRRQVKQPFEQCACFGAWIALASKTQRSRGQAKCPSPMSSTCRLAWTSSMRMTAPDSLGPGWTFSAKGRSFKFACFWIVLVNQLVSRWWRLLVWDGQTGLVFQSVAWWQTGRNLFLQPCRMRSQTMVALLAQQPKLPHGRSVRSKGMEVCGKKLSEELFGRIKFPDGKMSSWRQPLWTRPRTHWFEKVVSAPLNGCWDVTSVCQPVWLMTKRSWELVPKPLQLLQAAFSTARLSSGWQPEKLSLAVPQVEPWEEQSWGRSDQAVDLFSLACTFSTTMLKTRTQVQTAGEASLVWSGEKALQPFGFLTGDCFLQSALNTSREPTTQRSSTGRLSPKRQNWWTPHQQQVARGLLTWGDPRCPRWPLPMERPRGKAQMEKRNQRPWRMPQCSQQQPPEKKLRTWVQAQPAWLESGWSQTVNRRGLWSRPSSSTAWPSRDGSAETNSLQSFLRCPSLRTYQSQRRLSLTRKCTTFTSRAQLQRPWHGSLALWKLILRQKPMRERPSDSEPMSLEPTSCFPRTSQLLLLWRLRFQSFWKNKQ